MAQYILFVMLDPVEGGDDALNKWLDEVHIPEVLRTEGLVRNVRYERFNDAPENFPVPQKYMHYYEIETDDIESVMAAIYNPDPPLSPNVPELDRKSIVVSFYKRRS